MINDIPTEDEIFNTGLEFIMIAYDGVLNLLYALEDAPGIEEDEEKDFWINARPKLQNYAALMHQGAEFFIKSKICKISPYLLIVNNPDQYPKLIDGSVSFTDFVSQDASKLVKISSYFSDQPLTEDFIRLFDEGRKRRNKIIHSVNREMKIIATELLKEALLFVHEFMDEDWFSLREEFHEKNEEITLHGAYEAVPPKIIAEYNYLFDVLTKGELLKYTGIDKSRRFYFCEQCWRSSSDYLGDIETDFMILEPNTNESTILKCVICKTEREVIRKDCSEPDCKSNVIFADEDQECALCRNIE